MISLEGFDEILQEWIEDLKIIQSATVSKVCILVIKDVVVVSTCDVVLISLMKHLHIQQGQMTYQLALLFSQYNQSR